MPNRTRVFISYSHDSEQQMQFVLELAERLIEDGFNCVLDMSLEEDPAEGWLAWFENELVAADFTLVICTPTYLQHYQKPTLNYAEGEDFTGLVLSPALYERYKEQTKFVPVLPLGGKLTDAIAPLQGKNTFEVMTDYLGLHQLLKNKQPKRAQVEKQAPQWQDVNSQASTQPIGAQVAETVPPQATPLTSTVKQSTYLIIAVAAILMIGLALFMFA